MLDAAMGQMNALSLRQTFEDLLAFLTATFPKQNKS